MAFKNRQLYSEYWGWIPDKETPALLFDIETNGLIDQSTKIHCICAMDWLTKETFSFGPENIDDGLRLLSSYNVWVAHNGLCFDVPVLEKLSPLRADKHHTFDTLTASRLVWTDLTDLDFNRLRAAEKRRRRQGSVPVDFPKKLIGRHSLEAWGYRLGCYKGDYGKQVNAWDSWSKEMQEYCEQDVQVLAKLYEHILDQNYSPEALALEHEFQKVIFQQERTGVHFDRPKAVEMYAELASKRDRLVRELQEEFPPKIEEEVFIPKVNNRTRGYVKGVPFIKKYTIPFNPSSRQHIAERLQGLGWQPSEFTETGQPMVDETVLSALPYPCCKKLVEYLELTKIIGMLAEGNQAWLKLVTDKDRIHGRVITCGAVTGRCTHNSPNLAQIPARGTYGHQCRELFIPPAGWTMLGCDASGLELRMLASYMARYDGGKYGQVILEGDIHTENQNAAGLPTRNDAKTFIYALLYGAGDAKLGSIVAPTSSEAVQAKKGKALRAKFYKNIPALMRLTEDVQASAKSRGFLFGVDGRKLHIRSQHSALNTLLQSAGAVLMKLATVIFHWEMAKNGYVIGQDYVQVLHIHDEAECECPEELAEIIGTTFVRAIELAGLHFGFPCPTTGEFKVGPNWAETH